MKKWYTYILTNKKNGTLYTWVTSDIIRRIYEHKNNLIDWFSKKYNTHILVYYEIFENITDAIEREKQLKSWKRDWKIKLIKEENPLWNDLYKEIIE